MRNVIVFDDLPEDIKIEIFKFSRTNKKRISIFGILMLLLLYLWIKDVIYGVEYKQCYIKCYAF